MTAEWISAKRLRAHGLILAICLWSVYVWNICTPGLFDRGRNLKGTDFLHLYTLGSLALAHRGADLYNLEAQGALAAQRVPAAAGLKYLPLYPPQVSLLFAPFATCSYPSALALWLALSILIYSICCYAVWKTCDNLREQKVTVAILALAYPAFWHLINWGQTSALALACFTLAYFALRSRREFLAGMALGGLIFKPQLGLAAAIIFLLTLNWKVIGGALLSGIAELAAGCFFYGRGPLLEWTRTLKDVPRLLPLLEPRIYQTHSLRTFWAMLIPWSSIALALYLVSGLAIVGLTLICWRSRLPLSVRFSVLLFATALIAPHLTVYDLVILAPGFLLLSDWVVSHGHSADVNQLKILLYLAFALPLLGPLARWTHFQLSVPVMAAVIYAVWKSSNDALLAMQSE